MSDKPESMTLLSTDLEALLNLFALPGRCLPPFPEREVCKRSAALLLLFLSNTIS
jgi:hypothetical protein